MTKKPNGTDLYHGGPDHLWNGDRGRGSPSQAAAAAAAVLPRIPRCPLAKCSVPCLSSRFIDKQIQVAGEVSPPIFVHFYGKNRSHPQVEANHAHETHRNCQFRLTYLTELRGTHPFPSNKSDFGLSGVRPTGAVPPASTASPWGGVVSGGQSGSSHATAAGGTPSSQAQLRCSSFFGAQNPMFFWVQGIDPWTWRW